MSMFIAFNLRHMTGPGVQWRVSFTDKVYFKFVTER